LQHPDEHRPERPILLAVDQQVGERPSRRVPSVGLDHAHSLEVREHQDVEQLGAGSRTEGVEAGSESALEFVGAHVPEVTRRDRCTHKER
jgi:hypothetical protein